MLKRKRKDNPDYDFGLLRTWVNDKLTHGHTWGLTRRPYQRTSSSFKQEVVMWLGRT